MRVGLDRITRETITVISLITTNIDDENTWVYSDALLHCSVIGSTIPLKWGGGRGGGSVPQ